MITSTLDIGTIPKVLFCLFFLVFFVYYNIAPNVEPAPTRRLKILGGGAELLIIGGVSLFIELLFYLYILTIWKPSLSIWVYIINIVIFLVLTLIILVNGFIRTFATSDQLTAVQRICIVLMWWIPVANLLVIGSVVKTVISEYRFKTKKTRLNESRKNQRICETKYPILMVHGIFFRDWEKFNYWGRVPRELQDNGATIYYGHQESSTSVEHSAEQLKDKILEVIRESGRDKVNIIAHSKGGLDTRYAISCLGMDKHVASLTTVNTPHHGTVLAKTGLKFAPDKVVTFIDEKYDRLFKKLGDDSPDFFAGVKELTPERCEDLNSQMKDCEGVWYRSVGTAMSLPKNTVFPLNVSFTLIDKLVGSNDGLVDTKSMEWGDFLGITKNDENDKGISHGDVIDLTRKNIPGFDVCEFYVELVQELKDKGY